MKLEDGKLILTEAEFAEVKKANTAATPSIAGFYLRSFIKNKNLAEDLENQPEVRFTDKEQTFFDNVLNHYDSTELYFYVKNAINKARKTMVYVDDDGELVN